MSEQPIAEKDVPIWCLVCNVSSEGSTYLAFIHEHAGHDEAGRLRGPRAMIETGHEHDSAAVCTRDCSGWHSVQRAKRRALRRAKRRLLRTRIACLLTGGHKWLRMLEGDGSLAFIDCRKCGFRP